MSAAERHTLSTPVGESVTRWLDGPVDARTNVERDEELLDSARPAARVAPLLNTSLSLGAGQSADAPAARTAARLGIQVVRRSSGGSGLLHLEGDLAWSVVLPRDDPLVGSDFTSAYSRLGSGVVDFLGELGVEAEWSRPFGISESFCLLGSRGSVLTAEGRAIGGAAQHATRSAILHQGILSYGIDRELLGRLFDLDERTVRTTVSSLRELGVGEPPYLLGARLVERLCETIRPSG